MPLYLFIGTEPRVFPADDGLHRSFEVNPGDTLEADNNPDPHWFDEETIGPPENKEQ